MLSEYNLSVRSQMSAPKSNRSARRQMENFNLMFFIFGRNNPL